MELRGQLGGMMSLKLIAEHSLVDLNEMEARYHGCVNLSSNDSATFITGGRHSGKREHSPKILLKDGVIRVFIMNT